MESNGFGLDGNPCIVQNQLSYSMKRVADLNNDSLTETIRGSSSLFYQYLGKAGSRNERGFIFLFSAQLQRSLPAAADHQPVDEAGAEISCPYDIRCQPVCPSLGSDGFFEGAAVA